MKDMSQNSENIQPWQHHTASEDKEVITITLWPYRSLSPRGFAAVMAFFGLSCFMLGSLFYFLGAWPVIGFLGLEIGIVWLAFRFNYLAGNAFEEIEISSRGVTLRRFDARKTIRQKLNISIWVRAECLPKNAERQKLYLRHHSQQIEIGAFLPPSEKPGLAAALNRSIDRQMGAGQQVG